MGAYIQRHLPWSNSCGKAGRYHKCNFEELYKYDNLASAEGHPAAVMDMSFANQALSAEYMAQNAASLEKTVYVVPEEIDAEIARLKLYSMGVEIDALTEEQQKYLASWDQGT